MNLRDRMNSESQPSQRQGAELMTSDSITQKLNPQPRDSILQKQSETIQKQSEEIQRLTSTIREMQSQMGGIMQELEHLKKQGRPTDIEEIQILSSEKSELKSAIAELRAELSSVQKINQSLTRNNQLLSQSNDDLRNNAGLMSIREQKLLEEKNRALVDWNAELERHVNMSSVEAVRSAQTAQKAAEQKAKQDILACKAEARGKVYTATLEKNAAIKDARNRVRNAEKSKQTAWRTFIFTLLCCLVAHPTCMLDIGRFVCAPIIWIWDSFNIYTKWIHNPYYSKIVGTVEKTYSFPSAWAWVLRFLSLFIIPACAFCICYGILWVCQCYRKRWCMLSLKVLLVSIVIIIVFGEEIREYVGINLIWILIIIQAVYLYILGKLDKYYDSINSIDDWIRIQNT